MRFAFRWLIAVIPLLGAASGVAAPASLMAAATPVARNLIYVHDFGSSTAAIQAAINAACGGGQVVFDPAVYTVSDTLKLCSDLTVNGNGATLKLAGGAPHNHKLLSASHVSNIEVFGLTLDGNVTEQTWSELIQTIGIYAASNVRIHNNRFQNLVGDGVIVEGCASHVTITDNHFIGNHTNRNGVSVICADTVTIADNTFHAMSRFDMPGAIDLEPHLPGEHLTNVVVSGNTIDGGDGSITTNSGIRMDDAFGSVISNVVIGSNQIRGPGIWTGIEVIAPPGVTVTVQDNRVRELVGSKRPALEGDQPAGLLVRGGMTAVATNNTIATIRGYGIRNHRSCLRLEGNSIQQTTLAPVSQTAATCH